jgi:four helix bundle protein
MKDFGETFQPLSKGFVKDYTDLLAYRTSFELRKEIFETTKQFPKEEIYALTDQFRRAIRSVGANIAEGWGKRRYEKHFISKLTDADAERLETQHKCTASHVMVISLRSKWAAGKARGGRISGSICNRRATQPSAHFHRNPPGRRRCRHYMRDGTPAQNLV